LKNRIFILAAAFFIITPVIRIITYVPVYSRNGFALNTFINITIYGGSDEILNECFEDIKKYENMFSKALPASELYVLNHSEGAEPVSPEVYYLIKKSVEISQKTGGLYDITVEPVMGLWDFGEPAFPDENELAEKLALVNYENIELTPGGGVILKNGARVDLGSIAKGYITDVLADNLRERGVESAIIDLGGNIYALGKKNNKNWKVGIQKPFAQDGELLGYFEISDRSVVTSGTYQRYFEQDGRIYHHILNPLTGYPAESGLMSVSVVSASSTDADAFSTACLLLGLDKAIALIEETPDTEAVFVADTGEVFYSSGVGNSAMFYTTEP